MTQPPPPICDYCGKPIVPPDRPVVMAKQVDTTAFGTGRQWTDGIHVLFRAEHAPREACGYWRRLS